MLGSPLVTSERDGCHTREMVLFWGLIEQARHEHMSDKYLKQYIMDVPR